MSQIDWIGASEKKSRSFKDISNQRPSTAEQKARLCHQIGALINRVPKSIMSAGIERTREWRAARDLSAKAVQSSRTSTTELQIALKRMQAFE